MLVTSLSTVDAALTIIGEPNQTIIDFDSGDSAPTANDSYEQADGFGGFFQISQIPLGSETLEFTTVPVQVPLSNVGTNELTSVGSQDFKIRVTHSDPSVTFSFVSVIIRDNGPPENGVNLTVEADNSGQSDFFQSINILFPGGPKNANNLFGVFANSFTLTLSGSSTFDKGFIDDITFEVSAAAVPEPSTYIMFLGLVMFIGHRKVKS